MRIILNIFALAAVLLVGCAHNQDRANLAEGQVLYPNWDMGGKKEFIDNVHDRWGGRLILVGEIHGTNEIPKVVADIFDGMATGGDVVLGLEIPESEQTKVDAYLKSLGEPKDIERLIDSQFWKAPADWQDGRRSAAMLYLLDHIRIIVGKGMKVRVACLDAGSGNRQVQIAKKIKNEYENSAGMVVLIGNYHIFTKEQRESDEGEVVDYLLESNPVVINVRSRHGNYWACIGGRCKTQMARGGISPLSNDASFSWDGAGDGGELILPHISASVPASDIALPIPR